MATTINSVSPTLLATMNPSSADSATSSAEEGVSQLQNNFLTLLTTQMKNQNPLDPMDNSQVTSQMAQLSTVTGINQMNARLTSLISSMQATQSMQATDLIGKSVVVPGSEVTLSSGTGQFGVRLDSPATNVQAVIRDASGVIVNTLNVGSLPSGVSAINWDGKTDSGATAPDGSYTFTITAQNGSTSVNATGLSVGLVSSISTGGASGAMLNIPTLGSISFSNVLQIL